MATITISKSLIKEKELVVIPRKQYEELLRLAQKSREPFNKQFDKDLDKSIKEYKEGKFFGPFYNAKEGIKFLETHRKGKK